MHHNWIILLRNRVVKIQAEKCGTGSEKDTSIVRRSRAQGKEAPIRKIVRSYTSKSSRVRNVVNVTAKEAERAPYRGTTILRPFPRRHRFHICPQYFFSFYRPHLRRPVYILLLSDWLTLTDWMQKRPYASWLYSANLEDVWTYGFLYSGGQLTDGAGGLAAYEKPKVQKTAIF